eukprot:7697962-Pyramimonas_sp.AAC.1
MSVQAAVANRIVEVNGSPSEAKLQQHVRTIGRIMHEATVYQQRFQKQQHQLRQLDVEAQAFFQAGLHHFGDPDFQKQAQRIICESSARTAIAEAQCTQAWQN